MEILGIASCIRGAAKIVFTVRFPRRIMPSCWIPSSVSFSPGFAASDFIQGNARC